MMIGQEELMKMRFSSRHALDGLQVIQGLRMERLLRLFWSGVQYAVVFAGMTWICLVILNVKMLLATSQVRNSSEAIVTAVRLPVW